jgi:hypothetical protein
MGTGIPQCGNGSTESNVVSVVALAFKNPIPEFKNLTEFPIIALSSKNKIAGDISIVPSKNQYLPLVKYFHSPSTEHEIHAIFNAKDVEIYTGLQTRHGVTNITASLYFPDVLKIPLQSVMPLSKI